MKRVCLYLLLLVFGAACKGKKVPDVSTVKVDLQLQRFDQDFFLVDSNRVGQSLQQLQRKYPVFLQDFIFNILSLPQQPDSAAEVEGQVAEFVKSYKPIKDTADIIFKDLSGIQNEVATGLKFVKHYFPAYKVPTKLITFIGPINSYGNILTSDALAVGLQMYMGRNYSIYQSEAGQELYPAYISRRFEKEYIPVNCMKTIVDDMFPDNSAGRPLIEQMVQTGKRLYLLDQLMPNAADTLKTGYTASQLKGCFDNESTIWSFFVQSDFLYSSDPSITKDYMNDGPKTQAFGEQSPGFIGQFIGWQIVKKWISKHDNVTLKELMETNPKQIFTEAKYKP